MQTTQDTLARAAVVVLDEIEIDAKIRKNPAVPCLHKKTPLIAKNPRFKD
jgi:hypothetical protein